MSDLKVGLKGLAHARLAEDGAVGNVSHQKLDNDHQLLNLKTKHGIRMNFEMQVKAFNRLLEADGGVLRGLATRLQQVLVCLRVLQLDGLDPT